MSADGRFIRRAGRMLQTAAGALLRYKSLSEVWIDVGAHLGETTFGFARDHPSLKIYAFEPNLRLAAQRSGLLPNFVVIPMAVSEKDGCSDFYLNDFDSASSLLPFEPKGLEQWTGGGKLRVVDKVRVPTIRLDTFMNWIGISCVEYLKIDAQGADLSVVRSLGERIGHVRKITLEVATTPFRLYVGAATKEEVGCYLSERGFVLASAERQSQGQEENLTFLRR